MKTSIYTISGLIALILISGFITPTLAQSKSGIFEQLQQEEIPNLALQLDLSQLLSDKTVDVDFPAQLEWETSSDQKAQWDLKVNIRGKFRRMNCDFPPLRLHFPKDQLKAAGLNKHNKLKLVTHCLDERGEGQQNLLKEYLAYKLFQELSPNAYRVQLVRIQYIDKSRKLGSFRRYAFIIEDTDDMASRIGGKECDQCLNPDPVTLDRPAENLHALFQFMIGNTDFNLPMVRNMKLVTLPNGKLIPVGYDFDFSGFVNAPYALPSSHLGQRSVRDRIFLGLYTDDQILRKNLQHFINKRETLLAMVDNFRLLSRAERNDLLAYLNSFYTEIELAHSSNRSIYQVLRESYPAAIPAGARQEHYRVAK